MSAPMTVWKYPLPWPPPSRVLTLDLPRGAEILTCAEQGGAPVLWARVNPEEPSKETRRVAIVGTGHPAPDHDQGRYIGTMLFGHGALVLHLFEAIEASERPRDA